ncbi:MAG TPA: N-acetyl-alpha-D-glucosaminyl L-malate synthase BshA [Ginsengibacter sp.]|nr:N-acetyl-alpha-D-glucosaminyl L-malate synthase BshA [Chitinophagaceae bacterium]HRN72992.1 N-acetyl-alpha-D-glucosaminyl L-malate synthase BshA [Ginsengibacter sp.]HRP16765.1 N-acetyl-alpha-D-glucosaminyl L-malate synthase BshA [Ginsengibacter sp.]
MNIGIVCYPTFGGSGVLATELGKALAEKGHNIHFITYQQPVRLGGFHANIFYHEVTVPAYPLFDFPPYETALASTMVDVILNHHLDLLHVHYAIPHASAAYMARKIAEGHGIHIPVVTTLHGTDITLVGRDKTYSPVVTFSINESNAITAVSKNLRDETYKNFQINKEIEVIYNFVDAHRFNKKPLTPFRKAIAPNGEMIITHASNFRKIKRVQDVVYVFEKVLKKVPAKLLLIGDGPERSKVEEICRHNNTCEHTRFLGRQEEMEDILAISDLFILPSEYESFGLSALEAMASGVPVISTNVGGLPEININGVTGFLSAVGDIDDMATHTIRILSDPQLMAQMRKNVFEQAKKFDIQNIVPKYEALYKSLVTEAISLK